MVRGVKLICTSTHAIGFTVSVLLTSVLWVERFTGSSRGHAFLVGVCLLADSFEMTQMMQVIQRIRSATLVSLQCSAMAPVCQAMAR